MGRILDEWLNRNSAQLSSMSGRPPPPIAGMQGAPGGPPQTAFGQAVRGSAPPGFPASGPSGAGSFAPGGGAQPAFAPQQPVAAPVDVKAPPAAAPTEAPKPQKKGASFAEMYGEADTESINKAINLLEDQTGRSVEELYQQQTGHPPPRGTKKEKIGEFLFEFGLNLLAAPAGESSIENVGRSAIAARETQKGRDVAHRTEQEFQEEKQIAEQERRQGRRDKAFDRAATVERLDLERQRVQVQMDKQFADKFDNYVGEDGYMYTYNEATGEGRRVMVGGKPVKPDPKMNKTTSQRFDTEVRYNLYMGVHGRDPDGKPLAGDDLKTVQKGALKFANRERAYTPDQARRDAVKQATTMLSKDTNYTLADPEEQKAMLDEKVREYTELLMYGSGPGSGEPDPSRLAEGVATPVTNDAGVTEHWTLQNGVPRRVSENELRQ